MTATAEPAVDPAAQAERPAAPFYRLGGRPFFEAISERFYDLMDADPAYADLRAMHAPDLAKMRKSLAGFLSGWSGGPRDWFEENPGKCMMSAHKPFAITPAIAGQWADCMKRAIADSTSQDPELAKTLAGVLEQMALGMGR